MAEVVDFLAASAKRAARTFDARQEAARPVSSPAPWQRVRCAHNSGNGDCLAKCAEACMCNREPITLGFIARREVAKLKANRNPHSPMNVAPLLRPGRDAGSIAEIEQRYVGAMAFLEDL